MTPPDERPLARFPALCAVCRDWIESASSADEAAEPLAHRYCARSRATRAVVSGMADLLSPAAPEGGA